MSTVPNIIPISDLRQDASGIVKRTSTSREPVFITQRGRSAAVLMGANAYERTQRELEILRILAKGEAEIQAGIGFDFKTVMSEASALLHEP